MSAIAVAFSPSASSMPTIADLKQTILLNSPSSWRDICIGSELVVNLTP